MDPRAGDPRGRSVGKDTDFDALLQGFVTGTRIRVILRLRVVRRCGISMRSVYFGFRGVSCFLTEI